uniref:Uncharacterized protein n=1 Tax=Streptomyces sp. NBC_00049 TaxID=2903617 RepID=A0AAU2K033_9ACTN
MRATDGIVGDRRRCSGALAAQNVLDREWDFPLPPELFAPLRAPRHHSQNGTRRGYLTPPYGLC